MPAKLRDNSPERKGEREKKERSRSEKDRAERRERHKSSTHRTSSTREKAASRTSLSSVDESSRRTSMPATVKPDDGSINSEPKSNIPYPSFSKAHSKEAVGSHHSLNLFTPPPTDVDTLKSSPTKSASAQNGPPSPPLTEKTSARPVRTNSRTTTVETIVEEEKTENRKDTIKKDAPSTVRITKVRSNSYKRPSTEPNPLHATKSTKERSGTTLRRTETPTKISQRSVSQPISQQTRTISPTPSASATELTANGSSDATSIAPEQPQIQRPGSKVLPTATFEPSQSPVRATIQPVSRRETPIDVFNDQASAVPTPASGFTGFTGLSVPPPPPPPPLVPIAVPRVDYLLHHGGLNTPVPKNLLFAGKPMAVQQAQLHPGQPPIVVANLFEPYNSLLNDYEKVMNKNGSLAVATGYRSVARRLLDRLENVFARDISCEFCACPICAREPQLEDSRGVSWGEILELVSGRRELPSWPPFALVAEPNGLGIDVEVQAPMQKVDIDVPEEYREHYIRQSRKTKQSVDKWLHRQNDSSGNAPDELDHETLTFTILTHLSVEQRQPYKDLLGIVDKPLGPPRRAPSPDSKGQPKPPPTPQLRERMPHVVTAGHAIQRLYRLAALPRDPETALFLLNNFTLHNALATLSAVSNDEWEILISGRFDGFLRSGAEDLHEVPGRYTPQRMPLRNGTPGYMNGHSRSGSYPSRQSTPAVVAAQHGAPIALDEETEIAIVAEMERDIYKGMEALEDAFEALHQRAEIVRRALRERGAGLAAAAQRRRGSGISNIEVRTDTPASVVDRWDSETDDGLGDWDGVSEIAPDDSASNVSSARRRRPKRRNERRTPAMIEEDDDENAESEGTQSPRKR